MSNLSIGLVTSPSEECEQMVQLLQNAGINIQYHIKPEEIAAQHIEDSELNVWLLNVNDDDWHDNIDQLLDESDASIYFNEPGTLEKQEHPEFWCKSLVARLYEITGIENDQESSNGADNSDARTEASALSETELSKNSVNQEPIVESIDELGSALDDLESNSVGLPSDVAADLVSELQNISPDFEIDINDEISETIIQEGVNFEQEGTTDLNIDTNVASELETENETKLEIGLVAATSSQPESELDADFGFPNNTIPMLESARDDIQTASEFSYDFEDKNDPLVAQTESEISDLFSMEEEQANLNLAASLELNETPVSDLEIPDASHIETSSIEISGLELEPEMNQQDETSNQVFGKAEFIVDDDNPNDQEVPDYEEISVSEDTDGFSLESIEEEQVPITGKSVFIEEEPEETLDDGDNNGGENIDVEENNDGLTLEANENDRPTGKAVFIENEDEEELQKNDENELDSEIVLDDGGLTLEPNGSEPSTGKANFSVDEELETSHDDSDSAINQQASADEEVVLIDELQAGSLELESMNTEFANSETSLELANPVLVDSGNMESDLVESDLEEVDLEESESQQIDSEQYFESEVSLNEIADDTDEQESMSIPTLDLTESIHSDEESSLIPTISDELLETDLDEQDTIEPVVVESFLTSSDEVETFEIPMLEESVIDLEFEVPDAPIVQEPFTPCWTIGASLGGPAAVKRFFQSLPADINASFIVVQHIDESFLPVMAEILSSNSQFDVQVANGSNLMEAGKVYLAPLKGKIIFLQDGSMLVDHSQKWSDPYSPCIDDVISSLANVYGDNCGSIIFSGMGEDGKKGCEIMAAKGGQVWTQSVETCANPSMPNAIINANLASVVATPEMLADRLVKTLSEKVDG